MATVAQTAATWTWPPDLLAFAAEQGVSAYLDPLLDATRRAFPRAPLETVIEDDPEVPDDRRIVFRVDVTGWSADAIFNAENIWTEDLFRHCPATHVWVFHLGMVATP
jgi:DNA-binding transcriptional LysR family regulator